ncbi:FAD-dependent oxidoreductase [Actinokineospora bangkokensis]|uniref:FAD-dependent oxidoreductase n=1 Tax=Actinokineospora bangkokensis TaxID=1193682 RepID=UPI001177FB58|nr:NAD(P)/FAD-dependent oxidoreductase [Actinokineospora bangkokensis]
MVVVGAGMGGLVLAHGLAANGIEVRVHERDARAADTGGYRLHLGPDACAALRHAVPAAVYQAVVASSAGAAGFRQFSMFDHRLRLLTSLATEPGENLLIGRVALRSLLADSLPTTTRFSSEFTTFSRSGKQITAHFADGTADDCDLLVGADGVRSRVVRQLAGRRLARALPERGFAGQAEWDDVASGMPEELLSGPAFVIGPDGVAMFLSAHDPSSSDIDPVAVGAPAQPATVLWGVISHDDVDVDAVARWAPWVRVLLDRTPAGAVTRFPFHAVDPAADLTPWQAGRVTALGDAVHAMPPTGGQGAGTAIRDAWLLASSLAAADVDTIPLAVRDYQRGMADYAAAAVRESLQPLRWRRAVSSPVGFGAVRVAAAVSSAVRALRRAAPSTAGR